MVHRFYSHSRHAMIKKRHIPPSTHTYKKKNTEPDRGSSPDNDDDTLSQSILAVKTLHRFKKQGRGLTFYQPTGNSNASVSQKSDISYVNPSSTEASSYRLLDKSFHSQAAAPERLVDKDLEKFLEERLQELVTVHPKQKDPESPTHALREAEQELKDNLFQLPQHLKVSDCAQEEKHKMSWITGLVEVPLALDAKLKTIEDVEAMKYREIAAKRNQRVQLVDGPSNQNNILGHRFRKPFPRN